MARVLCYKPPGLSLNLLKVPLFVWCFPRSDLSQMSQVWPVPKLNKLLTHPPTHSNTNHFLPSNYSVSTIYQQLIIVSNIGFNYVYSRNRFLHGRNPHLATDPISPGALSSKLQQIRYHRKRNCHFECYLWSFKAIQSRISCW